MTRRRLSILLLVLLVYGPATSWAQSTANEWRYGTTLALFAGGASAASSTSPAVGAALGWEIVPHFTLEGSGAWTGEGDGARSFAALLGPRVNLMSPRTVVPFVSGGIGMARASFDSGAGDVPDFYARRMPEAAGTLRGRHTFQDVAFGLGGGFDVFLKRHLALRPDIRVFFVRAGATTRTMAVYGVHVAYHFESHPITPDRGAD
jgi:hypothetical protein